MTPPHDPLRLLGLALLFSFLLLGIVAGGFHVVAGLEASLHEDTLSTVDETARQRLRWVRHGLLVTNTALLGTLAVFLVRPLFHRARRQGTELADSRRERDDAETALRERTAELASSVREIEGFAYTVAHDLRSPLRAMEGFSRMLLEEHGPALDDLGRRRLETVCRNARQMGRLVDDLLLFVHLDRKPLDKRAVSTTDVVATCLENLRDAAPGRRIETRVGPLAACHADPALLQRLFTVLLDNAIKFTNGRDVACIEVGSTTTEGEPTVFFVRDDGIGFEAKYGERIFGIFQRLNRAEDYAGTGAGLAIARRIVERHGGRIHAEGAPGQGATISFTLEGKEPV